MAKEFKSGPFKGQGILRLAVIVAAGLAVASAAAYYSGLFGAFQ